MKKILVIACIMVMALAIGAQATTVDASWAVYFKAMNASTLANAMSIANFGTTATAIDGWKVGEDLKLSANSNAAEVIAAGGAGSATDRVYQDRRTALVAAEGSRKVWDLTVQTGAAFPAGVDILVKVWNPTGTYSLDASDMKVGLYKDGVLLKDITAGSNTTEANPFWSFTLTQSNVPYNFQLIAEVPSAVVTPEPGSMIALLSGLAGLGGLVIRRRK